ncbi:MAG: iron ABC transporter permease [Nitrospirae bacterium]|nr:iron ABC transporter permease [Nitrospirota bacterium]
MKKALFLILLILLLFTFIFSLMFGGSKVPLRETMEALFHPHQAGTVRTIIWQIRIPRIVLGFLVGAGLASCGVVFQGMLRNPLAEPYTLGVSGGAALGATLGIVLGLGGYWVPAMAFLGSLFSIAMIYFIVARRRFSVAGLILGGIILSFIFSSLVLLIFSLVRAERVQGAIFWLMGDLSSLQPALLKVIAFIIPAGILVFLLFGREIDLLTLGEERAAHLGLEAEGVKKILFLVASLITGAAVAATGIIGFVGLIVPHFLRRFTGPNHRLLIPAAALGGAVFLALSDTLARTIVAPLELPVGVITGILGGFFFLTFLLRAKRWDIS